jgi:hypothetical protein
MAPIPLFDPKRTNRRERFLGWSNSISIADLLISIIPLNDLVVSLLAFSLRTHLTGGIMNPKLVRAFSVGAIAVGAVTMAPPSFAADKDKIVGIWKLVSYEVEVQATGQKGPVMGNHPTGYVTFTPEGRVFFVLTGEARKPAKTDQERAELLSTLVAYTGTYSVEGDTWTTNVEVAWNPEWVGTKQVRNFTLSGERLVVLTPWRVMPNWANKGMTRSIVTFDKSK